jgi:hypothetical protein
MYAIKPVLLSSGTNFMGLCFPSVWAKAAFHNFPAVLQFLHCLFSLNDETDDKE